MSKISVFDIDAQKKRLKKIAHSSKYNKKNVVTYTTVSTNIYKRTSNLTGYIRYRLSIYRNGKTINKTFKTLEEAIHCRNNIHKKEKYTKKIYTIENKIQERLNSNGTYSFLIHISINGKVHAKTTQTLEKAREIRDNLLAKQKLAKRIKQLQRK